MQCDVTDLKGNHCPEEAAHTVIFKGVETHLCERCHANVLAGAYGRHLTPVAADGATLCHCERPRFAVSNPTKCIVCGKPRHR